MKKLHSVIVLIFLLAIANHVYAQCTSPTGASITTTPALCLGQGTVKVSSVTGGTPTDVYQYRLRYDSTSTTAIVKPFQLDSVFSNVAKGRYTVEIQKICSLGISSIYSLSGIVVTSPLTPLNISKITKLNKASCGNGSFKITATGGNNTVPYRYALVPTLTEPEPVVTYVRSPQYDSTFKNLNAGTYYARVYDTCGTYASATVVIDSLADTAIFTTNRSDYFFGLVIL